MLKGRGSLGFQRQDEGATYDAMRNTVLDEVKRAFNPEFLNRIDDIIVFRPLGLSEMERITGILLDQLRLRLSQQKIELEVTPEATQILIQRGFDPQLGARPLRRIIQKLLEDPLADQVLSGAVKEGSRVKAMAQGEEIVFEREAVPSES